MNPTATLRRRATFGGLHAVLAITCGIALMTSIKSANAQAIRPPDTTQVVGSNSPYRQIQLVAPQNASQSPFAPVYAPIYTPINTPTPVTHLMPVDYRQMPQDKLPSEADLQAKKKEEEAKKDVQAKKDEAKKDDKIPPNMIYTNSIGGCDYCHLFDSLSCQEQAFNLQCLFDSLSQPDPKAKKWYEKLTIRGYTQFRFDRTLETDPDGRNPNLFGDRGINGVSENFFIRRARLILFGDVSDYLYIYIQPDFASTPQGSTTSTFFGQLRDLYGDVYLDKEKVNRLRIGLSKVPYAWENLQSSQNRIPLDRTDAMNTAVAPNERDLGVIYYWTPEEKQKLLKVLVDGGLKGSGNYGIIGLGVYDGQGGSVPEANLNLHTVARFTWPWMLSNGQVVELGVQGYRGDYVVSGSQIRALGAGAAITPTGTGGTKGILEERVAGSFVWFPQPWGLQAEWQVGQGPGLNEFQTAVNSRSLYGGYVMSMYRCDTPCHGIWMPYCRYQQYHGGYRNQANAPFGDQRQVDIGVEWQIRKEMELTLEYSLIDTPNFTAINTPGVTPYRDFEGTALRLQFQVNY